MVGVLVVTHGNLARELVLAARRIVGEVKDLQAVSIDWDDDVGLAGKTIANAVREMDQGQGVLILTDMFGGTPANLAVTFVSSQVEVITGVNLPMLIKLARPARNAELLTLARDLREDGRNAIWVASDLLRGEKV